MLGFFLCSNLSTNCTTAHYNPADRIPLYVPVWLVLLFKILFLDYADSAIICPKKLQKMEGAN